MLKNQFKDKLEFDIYVVEQKVRIEKGFLTYSERETLKKMLDKNYKPILIEDLPPTKSLVTNIVELRKPCEEVEEGEDISEIIMYLKNTLNPKLGYGLSANQIGYNKKVSYLKIGKNINPKTKEVEYQELIVANPRIIEKDHKIVLPKEGCLSLPGIKIDTLRYVFITVEYEDEKRNRKMAALQDLEAFVWQHEVDHLNGITIIDRKYHKR